jgi:hypothetical protein
LHDDRCYFGFLSLGESSIGLSFVGHREEVGLYDDEIVASALHLDEIFGLHLLTDY